MFFPFFTILRLVLRFYPTGTRSANIFRSTEAPKCSNSEEGARHLQAGNYSEAEQNLGLALAEPAVRRSASKRLNLLLQLSESQRRQSKVAEASETMQRARQLAGTDKTEYARCLDQLAAIAADLGNYAEARRLLQESVSIEESFSPPHPAILAVRTQQLGIVCLQLGDLDAAYPLLERSLKFYEKGFGPDHAETGKRLAELAEIHHRQGNLPIALAQLERALAIHEKSTGPTSGEVINDLKLLAACHESAGEYEKAGACYERALKLQQSRVGGEPVELAEMILSLSRLSIGWQRFARAEELLPQAIPILERTPDHRLAAAQTMLGMLYERRGRFDDAEPMYEGALKLWEQRIQEYPAEVRQTLERLAVVIEQQGRTGEAESIRARVAIMRQPG